MSSPSIASVACEIPGGFSEYLPFTSKSSLLDFDIILFEPVLDTDYMWSNDTYLGKPSLSSNTSIWVRESANHWRRELQDALRAGKTIFVILPELQQVYVDTGLREHSGTGRNRQTTHIVEKFENYEILPVSITVTPSEGKAIILSGKGEILADYWREFGPYSRYVVLINGKIGSPALLTKSGGRTVGSILVNPDSGGALVLLPKLDLAHEDFYEEEADEEDCEEDEQEDGEGELVWTEAGKCFGAKFRESLVRIDAAFKAATSETPEPGWAEDEVYLLPRESEIQETLLSIEKKLKMLATERQHLKDKLAEEGRLRRLLYETGPSLEGAIVDTLCILGFNATPYRDADSEFDVVFESPEGRFIGEAEGRDHKPINISKLRQLEVNLHEDFEREDVDEMAMGVLFGNAFRLRSPETRGEFFTEKVFSAAKRSGIALIRTPDLFQIAQYLCGTYDALFAQACRKAIFDGAGKVVEFPSLPDQNNIQRRVQASIESS